MIIYIHNGIKDFMIPFYNRILSNRNIKLYITVDSDNKKKINGNVEVLKNKLLFSKYNINYNLPFKLLKENYEMLIANDPHTIETYIAYFITKLKRKKFILRNETFSWPRSPKSKLIEPIVKKIFKNADAIICVGKKSKEYAIFKGAKEQNIFISPYAVLKYPIKKQKNLYINKRVIFSLGRLVPYKGFDILIEAFLKLEKEIKNVILIIGTSKYKKNDYTKNILKLISISDNIKLVSINNENKGFYYSLSDIFVLPSTFRGCDADCWGLVLNEAMMFGKPIISTDATGAAYDVIIQGKNGFMVKRNSSEELYNALKKVLSNKHLSREMGKESKKIIEEKFTYEKMEYGFINAINHVLSQNKRPLFS